MTVDVAERPTAEVDIPASLAETLVDPRAYADTERLHAAYTWLRANNPVGVARVEGFDPFWVVTKHADILEISRQNALFLNGERPTVLTTQAGEQMARAITGGSPHMVYSLVQMDPPDHPKYRVLTQAWFLPQNLRKLESTIKDIAKDNVDRMAARTPACDFVADVALHYPLHVIMSILGVPPEDEPRMLKLTQELFGASDPDTARAAAPTDPVEAFKALSAVVEDFNRYFAAISADRKATPRDDLATVIANAEIDGKPMSERDQAGYYTIVATAGHDTTSSSTAGGMWALASDPSLLKRLQAEPELIPGFVEESIRWTTPVKTFQRTATEDYELRGRTIRKGDWLMLAYASGNRDEEVFEAPFEFRPDRKPNKQLAFGYGAHLCLGQHLARMEMKMLWEELIPRLKSVELAGEAKLTASYFVNGLKTLPIRFEMA